MIRLPAFFKVLFTVVPLTAVLLSGCQHNAQGNRYADYPIAEQFPQIYQQSIQAGAHWQLIAHNEARLLVSRFEETPTLQLADNADGNDSPFGRGFHNFLAEGLINEGALVYVAEQLLASMSLGLLKNPEGFGFPGSRNLQSYASAHNAELIEGTGMHWGVVAALIASDPKIRLVYRDWPIFGPVSVEAARAAIASQWQGKHEAFNAALYAGAGKLDSSAIRTAANRAGVYWPRLQADLIKHKAEIDALLARTNEQAPAIGLQGTPAFIIGAYLAPGALDLATLRKAVAEARRNPNGPARAR